MSRTVDNMYAIERSVYDSLKEATNAISEKLNEKDAYQSKIDSGRYSVNEINSKFMPEMARLRREISNDTDSALNKATTIVNEWWAKKQAENLLDPAKLTDDVKLLQPGIILTETDVQAIVDRSVGNKTMTQIAMRYANEHGFKVTTKDASSIYDKQLKESVESIILYYRNWIGTNIAMKMLDKFFGLA